MPITSGIAMGSIGIPSDVTKDTPTHATCDPMVAHATQAGSRPVWKRTHPNHAVATRPP